VANELISHTGSKLDASRESATAAAAAPTVDVASTNITTPPNSAFRYETTTVIDHVPMQVPLRLSLWRIAQLFARLRFRLFKNSFRGGAKSWYPAALGIVGAIVLGGFGIAAALVELSKPGIERATVVATCVVSFFAVVTLIGPIVLISADDSLSPQRLAPYPFTRAERLVGLLAAAVVSPLPFALGLCGIAAGFALTHRGEGLLLGVPSIVGCWLLLIALSKIIPTALAKLAQSRRGRDLSMVLGGLVGMTGWLWGRLSDLISRYGFERFARLSRFLRWSPPGAFARSLILSGSGSFSKALPFFAVGLVGLVGALGLWWLALGTAEGSAQGSAEGAFAIPASDTLRPGGLAGGHRKRTRSKTVPSQPLSAPTYREEGLFAGLLRFLPHTPLGAIAARELLYIVRHPRQRVAIASTLVLAVVVPIVNASNGKRSPEFTLIGSSAALLGALSAMNQVGIEGKALWIHLLSGVSPTTYLRGKNLALFVYLVPMVLITPTMLAFLTNGWAFLPAAYLAGFGALGVGIGLGTINSVKAPIPVPDSPNPFAGVSGQGCIAALWMFGSLIVTVIAMLPVAIALALTYKHPLLRILAATFGIGYGMLVWRLSVHYAAKKMAGREPELQAQVTPLG
jgi:ABC-2 type transport system permease protein